MANRATRRKFSRDYAKKSTRIFTCEYLGEDMDFELRYVSGADDIMSFRRDMIEISQLAKKAEAAGETEDNDTEAGLGLMNAINEYMIKMLKKVVVMDDADQMSDADWRQMAVNCGGFESPMWYACLESVGMGKMSRSGGDREHLPFSSAERQGAGTGS